mmetsp:Transcript_19799/g.51144  ORF Transcript_19799/g.51144 Transcript_19799/m.51144 type:complete len:232 (+) Transcript_19799:1080-1775(+)
MHTMCSCRSASTCVGVLMRSAAPKPSCPQSFTPQAYTAPASLSASRCVPPAATLMIGMPSRAGTGVGTSTAGASSSPPRPTAAGVVDVPQPSTCSPHVSRRPHGSTRAEKIESPFVPSPPAAAMSECVRTVFQARSARRSACVWLATRCAGGAIGLHCRAVKRARSAHSTGERRRAAPRKSRAVELTAMRSSRSRKERMRSMSSAGSVLSVMDGTAHERRTIATSCVPVAM